MEVRTVERQTGGCPNVLNEALFKVVAIAAFEGARGNGRWRFHREVKGEVKGKENNQIEYHFPVEMTDHR